MRPILEVHYRNVDKAPSIEELIQEKVYKLQQVFSDIMSCRVSIEKPQQHQKVGNPYRVRLDLKIPGGEVVAVRESSQGDMHDSLPKVIRDAFTAARRHLKERGRQMRGEVKVHPEQQVQAVVIRLFPEEEYGFLKTLDGREIYFHRNSVLNGDFDRLSVGTGVRLKEEMGEKGPQATVVQIIGKPGSTRTGIKEPKVEPPLGWGR
jgi:ribosome-associated translation inhibitor RaiA/cold shock CspA family protein